MNIRLNDVLNDVLSAVQVPFAGPLPIVEREADSGYTEPGFARVGADLRLATDWAATAAVKGLLTPAAGAAGVAKLVWNTPGASIFALPGAALGAFVGAGLGGIGWAYSSSRVALLAADAGGNMIYGAGDALMGAGTQIAHALLRQIEVPATKRQERRHAH